MRKKQSQQSGASAPTQTVPALVYPTDAAWQAIRRFSPKPPYPEFTVRSCHILFHLSVDGYLIEISTSCLELSVGLCQFELSVKKKFCKKIPLLDKNECCLLTGSSGRTSNKAYPSDSSSNPQEPGQIFSTWKKVKLAVQQAASDNYRNIIQCINMSFH